MRDYFWTADMSGIDWQAIAERYAPLIERVGSRAELSDLIWEIQGELGTSHAYESGGDHRRPPHYSQGYLGVEWMYDAVTQRYRLARILRGDPTDPMEASPLNAPGINAQVGDAVLAINGQRPTPTLPPQALLVYGKDSFLQQPFATVKPEMLFRYRDVRLYFCVEEQAFLPITKVSRNDAPDLTLFISANALKNPRFQLLLRFLRHRAKMVVGGTNPCHTPDMLAGGIDGAWMKSIRQQVSGNYKSAYRQPVCIEHCIHFGSIALGKRRPLQQLLTVASMSMTQQGVPLSVVIVCTVRSFNDEGDLWAVNVPSIVIEEVVRHLKTVKRP
jgi:hypothetical protein